MGLEPEIGKQHAEPLQKPSPGSVAHAPARDPQAAAQQTAAPQQAGNQALQASLHTGDRIKDLIDIDSLGHLVADRIANYFLGLLDAGEGLLHGVTLLLTDPMKVLEGLDKLPRTAKVHWKQKDRIWREFANAPPDRQARMIGPLFGEAEIVILTGGAGGGVEGAPGHGGAFTINLGQLGEAARLTSLMARSGEAGLKTQENAGKVEAKKAAPKPASEKAPPGEAPQKKLEPIQSGQWISMTWAERKAYIDQWMVEKGITRIVKTDDRHAWPMYLGGPESGPPIALDEQLHRAFHSGLNKILPGFEGTGRYTALSPSEKSNTIRALIAYTAEFDRYYKTRISQVLARALEGTSY